MLYIGLMSGTSADGMDGALVDVTDDGFRLLATRSRVHSGAVKASIESVIRSYPDVEETEITGLDEQLGADFAGLAAELIEDAGPDGSITAIGSHGQTIYHGPGDDPPVTIQLGDPQRIADLTGVTTVGDFRANDLRAGGQGAPLAPAFHNAMFRTGGIERMVVNIGGIANVTRLPADPDASVTGFDTGPGNTLMDQWCYAHTGKAFDAGGEWAARGRAGGEFVQALLADPYFAAPPPKSTGREYFHLEWLKARYPGWRDEDPVDIQAGLLEVTARSISEAIDRVRGGGTDDEIYICGGGAHNTALMARLGSMAAGKVSTTAALGLSPDWVEACAFAWLAHRRMRGRPGNLPSVTGATREVLLGEIHTPAGCRARPVA
ncbi:MAG: anhydro-N-acetylmuramic acid kinase [Arenicellales bacterium]